MVPKLTSCYRNNQVNIKQRRNRLKIRYVLFHLSIFSVKLKKIAVGECRNENN